MTDTVANHTILDNGDQVIMHMVGVSDGTGETAVIKLDKSALAAARSTALEAVSLDIERIEWCIQGYTAIEFKWNHTAAQLALALCGSGYKDFSGADVPLDTIGLVRTPGVKDPRGAGGTGDLELTSLGAVANATYDITIWCKKNPT